MDKREYFLLCIANEAYKHSAWVLRTYAVSILDKMGSREPTHPFEVFDNDGQYAFQDLQGEWVTIDWPITEPLFRKRERIELAHKEMLNVNQPDGVVTTYGNCLLNAVSLIYPFGDSFDFLTGVVDLKAFESRIIARLVDDVSDGEMEDPDKIYVRQLIKYIDATTNLDGYNKLFVPSATPYTMTAAPEALKRLEELLEEHKDHLNDPIVISKIKAEVIALDKAYIAQDPNAGFYQSSKSFDLVRQQIFYMYGMEAKFDGSGEYTFIRRPLDEGVDITKFPEMNDTVRDGSFSRGADTAIAGADVKVAYRSAVGTEIVDDCGTVVGEPAIITAENLDSFMGTYVFLNGVNTLVSDETKASLLHSQVYARTPGTCNGADGNYCVYCVGEFIRDRRKAMPSLAAGIFMDQMDLNMKKSNNSFLRTIKIDVGAVLS